ncbi:MAG: hypothetical protein AB1689_05160 [Thermodesulfobacteriota bacterium]
MLAYLRALPTTRSLPPPGPRRPALACLLAALATLGAAACDRGAEPVDLGKHERSVFSQSGEDGVLEKIFEIIEPTNRFAVEFGAGDGIENSNVRHLVVDRGWGGLMIEGDEQRAKELAANYADYPQVRTLQAWVFPGNIELLFEESGVPADLDLLVIDIDSNDYYVWRAIHDYRPKVVVIEVNPLFPPPQRMVIEFHPMNYWDRTDYFGASLQSLYDLGKKKGYELVYHNRFGNNAFFVDGRYFERFGIADNSPAALFHEPHAAVKLVLDRSPEGRNGVPFAPGNEVLRWGELVIPKKFRFDR